MDQQTNICTEQANNDIGKIYDQSNPSSSRQNQVFKKLLSNNDEIVNKKLEAVGADYAQQCKDETLDGQKEIFKSPPAASQEHKSNSSSEKKKKKRTPPKSKPVYNGNQSNKQKFAKNTQVSDEGMLNLTDSPLYSSNTKNGSKKNNLNYLLNFSYEKSSNENYEYEKFSKQFWSNKIAKSSYFSKEQFLQANCQFVVKNLGDYSPHMVDPDLMVEWSKIEEIHTDSNELISCPICLYPPQAGKITKCGHIFCWPCILHYLSLSDKTWRKCPICYESIYKNDLKSMVQNKYENEFKVGNLIEFELMSKFKSKLNTIILPYNLIEQLKSDEIKQTITFDLFNSEAYAGIKKYLKILSKNDKEIQSDIIERERIELNKLRTESIDQPEICFIDEALTLLVERESGLKTHIKPNKELIRNKSRSPEKSDLLAEDLENLGIEPLELLTDKKKVDQQECSYFYQSIDGQRIYICALNARMMMSEYSTFSKCPEKLTAKIVASESFFMSEDNRKRFRYLSHLPLHSEFRIVEVELNEEHVSIETQKLFEEEIHEKKRAREKKLMKEKRMAERSDPSIYDPHYYNSSAMNEPISWSNNNIIDYTNDFPQASTSPSTSSSGISSENNGTISKEQQPLSFAQMTRPGSNLKWAKANNPVGASTAWPSLDNQSNLTQHQSQLTNGWLSTAKLGPTLGRSKKVQSPPSPWAVKNSLAAEYENEEVEEADYMPARDYRESFFCGIDESLRELDSKKMDEWEAKLLSQDKSAENSIQTKPQQISKKKKRTGKLLFST